MILKHSKLSSRHDSEISNFGREIGVGSKIETTYDSKKGMKINSFIDRKEEEDC
jgi:hypothetical protein